MLKFRARIVSMESWHLSGSSCSALRYVLQSLAPETCSLLQRSPDLRAATGSTCDAAPVYYRQLNLVAASLAMLCRLAASMAGAECRRLIVPRFAERFGEFVGTVFGNLERRRCALC